MTLHLNAAFYQFSNIQLTAAWLAQLGERRVGVGVGGRGYEPRPDQHSGSLNNLEESAALM